MSDKSVSLTLGMGKETQARSKPKEDACFSDAQAKAQLTWDSPLYAVFTINE